MKQLLLICLLLLPCRALALTIATGSAEGTYFKIAQDIKQLADKEGIALDIIATGGSFDNINLLAAGKVDLAVMQLDVLRFVTELMLKETGLNVLEEAKVALNLYLEEIHIIARSAEIRTLQDLQGKRVSVGPEKSGSALTAEILLAGFELTVDRAEVPAAGPGSYYLFELVGCRCVDERAGELGTVVEVVADGGGWLVEVESREAGGGRRLSLPFAEEFLVSVDPAARRIDWRLPEGLIEACASRF